jgi:DNA-binding response OmpR family regulator
MENKKIILIAEDEKSLRDALDLKLVSSGFSIIEAKNGEEGLEFSLKEHPDLILLDISMPKMDGMTMLKKLRVDDWGKNVPVIMLTNISGDTDEMNKNITDLEPTYYFLKTDKSMGEIIEKIKERLNIE